MQSPEIRRRRLVEGFDIHLVVSMPMVRVDLYDVLYASLYDGLPVRRLPRRTGSPSYLLFAFLVGRTSSPSYGSSIVGADWKSVVPVVCLSVGRTSSPSYLLLL